jgi:hypothetical protein
VNLKRERTQLYVSFRVTRAEINFLIWVAEEAEHVLSLSPTLINEMRGYLMSDERTLFVV